MNLLLYEGMVQSMGGCPVIGNAHNGHMSTRSRDMIGTICLERIEMGKDWI